jgi:hypothetical protein
MKVDAVAHYTPWAYLPRIVESGELRPSNAGADNERPILWFSANPQWEPTATKLWHTPNGVKRLSFSQMEARVGAARFVLSGRDPRLMDWKTACAVAGTTREQRQALERTGRKSGADPLHWYGVESPVPLSDLQCHVLVEGKWKSADVAEMAKVWLDVCGKTT